MSPTDAAVLTPEAHADDAAATPAAATPTPTPSEETAPVTSAPSAPRPKAKPAPTPRPASAAKTPAKTAKPTPAAKRGDKPTPKAAAAAPAPKTPAKAPGRKPAPAGPSIRERVFKALAKSPEGLTGLQIKTQLGLGGVPSLLKDEGVVEKPRIKRAARDGVRGVVYQLTALGKKDLESGKVDDNAAPPSFGKDWPEGR